MITFDTAVLNAMIEQVDLEYEKGYDEIRVSLFKQVPLNDFVFLKPLHSFIIKPGETQQVSQFNFPEDFDAFAVEGVSPLSP